MLEMLSLQENIPQKAHWANGVGSEKHYYLMNCHGVDIRPGGLYALAGMLLRSFSDLFAMTNSA
jgi:hypothetical protein